MSEQDKPKTANAAKKYKTVRIYPEDFREYKRISYEQDKPIVELISEALEFMKQKYDSFS